MGGGSDALRQRNRKKGKIGGGAAKHHGGWVARRIVPISPPSTFDVFQKSQTIADHLIPSAEGGGISGILAIYDEHFSNFLG